MLRPGFLETSAVLATNHSGLNPGPTSGVTLGKLLNLCASVSSSVN